MYITHLAALSSLALSSAYNVHTQPPSAYNVYTQPPSLALSSAYNVHTQPPFQAPETRGGMYRHSQEHIHWLSCVHVLGKAFGGGGGAGRSEDSDDCSTTTVMTIARRQ